MPDKTLSCKDCGSEFVFSEGEQEFYKEKGFENEPLRCPDCRRRRKQNRRQNQNQNRYEEGSSW
ncbi:MAG TPA: cytochrome C551 [Fastidiosipila sp.]|jgi:DNA-directed RNA polymerase subunit RPC12/RpoP|nr:cytochrome C551 [Fastidiosipila sp.]